MIDLQAFCGGEDRPKSICTPWTRDGYTMATDGVILVRMPAVDGVAKNPDAPNVPAEWFEFEVPKWFDIPPISTLTAECEECVGTGWVIPKTAYNEYDEQDCKSCGGDGRTRRMESVKIGVAKFDGKVLAQLSVLPGIKIGPTGEFHIARFIFDGGEGVVMPVRE